MLISVGRPQAQATRFTDWRETKQRQAELREWTSEIPCMLCTLNVNLYIYIIYNTEREEVVNNREIFFIWEFSTKEVKAAKKFGNYRLIQSWVTIGQLNNNIVYCSVQVSLIKYIYLWSESCVIIKGLLEVRFAVQQFQLNSQIYLSCSLPFPNLLSF